MTSLKKSAKILNMTYKNRIINISKDESSFLFGVRGSGKTALLKRLFPPSPQTLYIDLLDASLYQRYLDDIGLFYEKVSAFRKDGLVIVDEIQKMPRLLDEVHRLIESSNRRFILTGSSARKLKAAEGVNLLGGRANKQLLHPFVPEELGEDFDLNAALRYGLLPIVQSSVNRDRQLRAYTETYLTEEIKAEALARNLPAFARFLEVAGLYHGQVINMNSVARDSQTSRHSVCNFFSILEDTMLGFFLPAYQAKLRVKERKGKKFYLIDPGIARALKKNFGPVSVEEKGFLFEGLIAQLLRSYQEYQGLCDSMYYWSSSEAKKTEVDFLLKRGKDLTAVEVKAKAQVSSQDYRGLRAVNELPNLERRIVVYLGEDIRKTKEGIEIQPFDFFCENLKEDFNRPVGYKQKKPSPPPLMNPMPLPLRSSEVFKPSDLQLPPPDNGEKFEKLCLDLYKAEFGNQTQRIGRPGQSQNGVDIFAPEGIGIQCKKRDLKGKITEKELKAEIQKAKRFKPPLKRFILAATCKRDAKIQEAARLISKECQEHNLFSVEIHSWEEIKELLDKHSEVYSKYYLPQDQTIWKKYWFDVENKETWRLESPPGSLYQRGRQLSEKLENSSQTSIKSIQSESRHQELNKIRDLLNENQPKTAFKLLEQFKQGKWDQLEDKTKYRVLTDMAFAKLEMRQEIQAAELFIKAQRFNKDEGAASNCALACLIIDDIKNAKKFIKNVKTLNPLNVNAFVLEIQIKDRERKNFREIVSALPEAVKTKPQTAHILSYISIKRKLYKEAEKYLEIFYNNREKDETGGWKEIKDEASYADMSLSLILERQDVLSSRRVPENLKARLNDIIKIYKKLNTNSRFSELREFNPDWPQHYALALEIKGELDKAVQILQTACESFPDDALLKIELSRLFERQGDRTNSVSVLESLLGLSFSASGGSSDSINKKPAVLNKMNISEKSFNLALILTDLYFHSDQKDKAWSLLDKTEKASSLNDEQRLEARQYRIFRLINFGKTEEAEEKLNLLYAEDSKHIINLILKSKIENVKANSQASAGKTDDSKSHREKSVQCLKEAVRVFKDKPYTEEGDRYSLGFETRERLRDLESLAAELYSSKMYKDLEPLLEEITNKNLNHPEIFKLLHVYLENGENRKLIDLAEALLQKFPKKAEPAHALFSVYERLGDRDKAVQYYENFMKANPENDFIRIELSIAYINNEQTLKAKKILEKDFNADKLSAEQTSRLSVAYSRTGYIKKALKILYRYIEKNPKALEPQKTYFELLSFSDHQNLYETQSQNKTSGALKPAEAEAIDSFLCPKKADTDCYIRIKNIESLEETEIVIEEGADIYNPDHQLSQKLLGKKEGDIIAFQGKKYEILEIKSRYVHKYQEIARENELKFASKAFVKSFPVPPQADINPFLQILKKEAPDISKQYENLDKILKLYSEGRAPIGFIAEMFGKHPIEAIDYLTADKKHKWISAVPAWENNHQKTQKLLEAKTDILIDLSSLITIHQLKIEKYMEGSKFKFYICQSAIDSLKEYIGKINLHSKDGLLTAGFDREGAFRTNSIPADIMQNRVAVGTAIKAWAEKHCQIKPLSIDIVLSQEQRREREKIFGKAFFDSLLAAGKDAVLLCEDAFLRKFGKQEFSVSGVRLFDLIEHFEKQAVIESNQAVQFRARLVQLNQTYIPVDHNILFFLLKESEYSVDSIGFQRGLFFLGPASDLSGAVSVTADFLIEMCQTPSLSLLPHSKQMIAKELLDTVSSERNESPKTTADLISHLVQIRTRLFLPRYQYEINGYIREWLKGKIY